MGEDFETRHVHEIYTQISHSFDTTRHTMWPQVHTWQSNLPDGTHVAEIGCGNGKNMTLPHLDYTGCDPCPTFVNICQSKGLNVTVGNIMDLPFTDSAFDAVMCIAVLHHLSTPERRQRGIDELLRICKPGGHLLISVWALKQDSTSRRQITEPDMLIPWQTQSLSRYYHMFEQPELEDLFVGCEVKTYYAASNWFAEVIKT